MKKFLFFVVILLALFTVDHPTIKEPRDAVLNHGIAILSDQSKVQRSPAAKIARTLITQELSLNQSELDYLNDALGTDDKLRAFHLRYCQEHDLNLYFYGDKLNVICRIAGESLTEGLTL